jgi:hypothetical protein
MDTALSSKLPTIEYRQNPISAHAEFYKDVIPYNSHPPTDKSEFYFPIFNMHNNVPSYAWMNGIADDNTSLITKDTTFGLRYVSKTITDPEFIHPVHIPLTDEAWAWMHDEIVDNVSIK